MSRMIDADEFENRMYHEAFERDSDMQKWDSGCWIRYRLFEEVLRGQPTVTPKPHWIPVTEDTLPEENRVVVVCGEKGTWDYGMYRGFLSTNVHLWDWKGKTLKKVYWWMYKEDALAMPYEE